MAIAELISKFSEEILSSTDGELTREKLTLLENEFIAKQDDAGQKNLNKQQYLSKLWIGLIEISVIHKKLDLTLLLVGRLKIAPLSRVMQSILAGKQPAEFSSRLALIYIANYFNITSSDYTNKWTVDMVLQKSKANEKFTRPLFEIEPVLQSWLDADEWTLVFDFISELPDKQQAQSISRMMFYERANQFEYEENFTDSLRSHERAGTGLSHAIRLALKRVPDSSSRDEFEKNCQAAPLDFTTIFALQNRDRLFESLKLKVDLVDNHKHEDETTLKSYFDLMLRLDFETARKIAFRELPENLVKFLLNFELSSMKEQHQNPQLSAKIRDLNQLMTNRQRSQLAQLAIHELELNPSECTLARAILFYLNQHSGLFDLLLVESRTNHGTVDDDKPKFTHLCDLLIQSEQKDTPSSYDTSLHIIELIDNNNSSTRKNRRNRSIRAKKANNYNLNIDDKTKLARLLLNQGLLDECLRVSLWTLNGQTSGAHGESMDPFSAKLWLSEACEYLLDIQIDSESSKNVQGKFFGDKLRHINVAIKLDTIELARRQLATQSIDKESVAALLSYVILALILSMQKRNCWQNMKSNSTKDNLVESNPMEIRWLEEFEIMAKNLAILLSLFTDGSSKDHSKLVIQFAASDLLIKSSSLLLKTAKLNFDQIQSSDIARDCLRDLVQLVADQCMMDGRYKQAAALHNQIEDHRSALKALMRVGDVDVVIEYAYLIQDVTIHRITLNYLRHIRAPPELIEDFESRIREQQRLNNMIQ